MQWSARGVLALYENQSGAGSIHPGSSSVCVNIQLCEEQWTSQLSSSDQTDLE